VEWVHLPKGPDLEGNRPADGGLAGSNLLGRTIGELGVRSETGASVLAVVRGEKVFPNPGADLRLEPGDAVGILGKPEQRAAFRVLAREPRQDDAAL
jgi:K+/H+ antiporter YhaU regulatory subunit KhtT